MTRNVGVPQASNVELHEVPSPGDSSPRRLLAALTGRAQRSPTRKLSGTLVGR